MRCLVFLLMLITPVMAEVRLIIGGKKAGLDSALIECELMGGLLVRHSKLTFANPGGRVAEGDLTCPLDDGEEIVSFAMDVNGERREGVVVSEKRGRHAYETIVARGVDPGLIEVSEVANEFRTRVFPIPAKGLKNVWITTVQTVGAGEVEVWPKGLGSPVIWELKISAQGGEAQEFPKLQRGISGSVPSSRFHWKPDRELAYRGDHGDVCFATYQSKPLSAGRLEVWLDGTSAIEPAAMKRLRELLAHFYQAAVTLRVFREELEEPVSFELGAGKAEELIKAIELAPRSGMARPQCLPWREVEADAVIFVTDGAFATGRGSILETPCPLHVIDTGKLESDWLRNQALKSGGGWHGPARLDPKAGLEGEGVSLVGEIVGDFFVVKSSRKVIETPIANWLWARLQSQKLNDRGESRLVIDDFNYRHGVMDSQSSIIVMETADQYFEFGVEPPVGDQKLYRRWEALRKNEEMNQAKWLDRLAANWVKRCDRLSEPVSPVDQRLLKEVRERRKELSFLESRNSQVKPGILAPLKKSLTKIADLATDGIEPGEISEVKEELERVARFENELEPTIPWMSITIGGQVRAPGPRMISKGSTLFDAVEAAGGPTPYGAVNRVKLYRKGKVYTYNLKMDEHKAVRLYPRDLVEVPQRNWLGNGGGGDRKTAAFAREPSVTIVFPKGKTQPPKYYLDALEKVLGDEEKFQDRYRVFRAACGWRADFYLDVIHLLEQEGHRERALKVAGDLAEHLPENPEILRRAARAYRRLGEKALSHELFEQIVRLEPRRPIALFDLARSEQALGRPGKALELYWKALQIAESTETSGCSIVILEEMNALIASEGLDAARFGIEERFVRHVPVDLRVVLSWDADQSNLDLLVRKPTGAWVVPWNSDRTASAGWWSGNATRGYGPKGWSMQGLLPGTYQFEACFYGDWNENGVSTVTGEIEFIRNFGTPEETREIQALRVEEKTQADVAKIKFLPEGWE